MPMLAPGLVERRATQSLAPEEAGRRLHMSLAFRDASTSRKRREQIPMPCQVVGQEVEPLAKVGKRLVGLP